MVIYHKSPEDLRNNRVRALNESANDYDKGKQEGRYRIGALPSLDFKKERVRYSLMLTLLFCTLSIMIISFITIQLERCSELVKRCVFSHY